ncbi:hypothetical protein C8R44DRAFT_788973 [Mycena epipterygia]|nr:hypothetical protein C8R44DRAFT_788973 [Mycena epipterygia]
MAEAKEKQGLLFVYVEPGPDVKESDLHDWYDGEHIPLRLTVPGFEAVARYKAIDSQIPTWLALYDVSGLSVLDSPEYKAMPSLASDNERAIMAKFSGLGRRTYTLISTTVHPETTAAALPGKYVMVVSYEIAPENEEDFNKWYDEEHMDLISRIPGWKRGRRYKLVDSAQLIGNAPDQPACKYLAIHEIDNKDFEESAEMKHARGTEWAQRVRNYAIRREIRVFELHKGFTKS